MSSAMLIRGPCRLKGRVRISGSKNAALPQLAACLLTDKSVTLANVPDLADVATMLGLLRGIGVEVKRKGDEVTLRAASIAPNKAAYELVRLMRASVLVLGPLLARLGEARVAMPGGCAIGPRPVDMHIKALVALGATTHLAKGDIHLKTDGLKGADITFGSVSVGATTNVIMAATLATGTTRLFNAATEPEIIDLCRFLTRLGAKIKFPPTAAAAKKIGVADYEIEGVAALGSNAAEQRYQITSDRIEGGTYAIAAAATGGEVMLEDCPIDELAELWRVLKASGVRVEPFADGVKVSGDGRPPKPIDIVTAPWPGFPTDLQAQWMALAAKGGGGEVKITEGVFPHRFIHAGELERLGAHIRIEGNYALVSPVARLQGAEVMATDLRASVALIIAALIGEGTTTVNRIYHLKRGYENLESKFTALGAEIREVS